tara:strand:- start:242 stop:409 length:168 start_codon:yes stop_codon:yes gene_type:complete
MLDIFIANGPSFISEKQIAPFKNVNIYPLICEILNIKPHPDIDGNINNISHILNQ